MDGPPPQRWDRSKWITVFSSHSPTIREVTECLGLGLSPSASTTNRGIPKFDAPEFKKLSSEVTRLSKELPQDKDALLDVASNPGAIDKELDELLDSLGPSIWGRDADRSRLVTPDPEKKTYYKDLYYEDPEDRDILKIHLQRWIVIKACYYIRNRKLKKHSVGEEFDSIADIDADSPAHKPEIVVKFPIQSSRQDLSPPQTPQSGSPMQAGSTTPKDEPATLPNLRKRKSSTFHSLSDGEDEHGTSSAGPRKRSYHSAALPIQRKSPRKSISNGRLSSENIPPLPQQNHLHPPASNRDDTGATSPAPSPDAGRPGLSPLSNNALNGATRPSNPPLNGFAAVNVPRTSTPPAPSAFSTINGPSAAANPPPSAFAAVNVPRTEANASPNSFATINTPNPPPNASPPVTVAKVSNSPPIVPASAFAAVNGPREAATTSPSTFAPANLPSSAMSNSPSSFASGNAPSAPGGFTAVNVSSSSNVPIAPNPSSYSSPYAGAEQSSRHAQLAPNGHNQAIPHHPPQHANPSAYQREPSPQKQPAVHRHESQPPPHSHSSTPLVPNGPTSSMQQTYHTHSIPPAPGVSQIHPKFHGHQASNGAPLAPAPILPSNAPLRPNTNGHMPEHRLEPRPEHRMEHRPEHRPEPIPEYRPAARAASPIDMTLLQCELLGLLMRYFFPRSGARLDEPILLQNLEYIWTANEPSFRKTMGHFYDLQHKILYAWMEERRKISQLQYIMESQPGVRASEMVDRLLAMNDLRVLRLKWKAMKTQDGVNGGSVGGNALSPEDWLCRTFATMTKTEGTEHLFKEGLERLNESVFEFLKSEDMKISMRKG